MIKNVYLLISMLTSVYRLLLLKIEGWINVFSYRCINPSLFSFSSLSVRPSSHVGLNSHKAEGSETNSPSLSPALGS